MLGLVAQQAVAAFLALALLPQPDRRTTDASLPGHFLHSQALGREQDHASSQDVSEGRDQSPQSRPAVMWLRS